MRVAAIVIAAGRGARFAEADPGAPPKMMTLIDGVPMIRRTVESLVAGGVERTIVVVASDQATAVARTLWGLVVTCVVNPDPDRGMFSSIQCGMAAAVDVATCVVMPGDMPFVEPATVVRLISAATMTGRTVVPRLDGHPGHPVVCGSGLRIRILGAPPDARLDHLLMDHGVSFVDVTDPGVRRDVDRPGDLPHSI